MYYLFGHSSLPHLPCVASSVPISFAIFSSIHSKMEAKVFRLTRQFGYSIILSDDNEVAKC